MTTRRTLLRGLGAILCAPAIVKVGSIMPVREARWTASVAWSDDYWWDTRAFADALRAQLETHRLRSGDPAIFVSTGGYPDTIVYEGPSAPVRQMQPDDVLRIKYQVALD